MASKTVCDKCGCALNEKSGHVAETLIALAEGGVPTERFWRLQLSMRRTKGNAQDTCDLCRTCLVEQAMEMLKAEIGRMIANPDEQREVPF